MFKDLIEFLCRPHSFFQQCVNAYFYFLSCVYVYIYVDVNVRRYKVEMYIIYIYMFSCNSMCLSGCLPQTFWSKLIGTSACSGSTSDFPKTTLICCHQIMSNSSNKKCIYIYMYVYIPHSPENHNQSLKQRVMVLEFLLYVHSWLWEKKLVCPCYR